MKATYSEFVRRMEEIAILGNAIGLLHWDKETYMPKGTVTLRARQISGLTGMVHGMFVDPAFGELLSDLMASNDLDKIERRNVELTLRDYKKEVKLSKAFVEKLSKASAEAFHAWDHAKKESDFKQFYPSLEALINLKLEEAELRGYDNHPYDVFLDLYEPELNVNTLDSLFTEARNGIMTLLDKLKPEEKQIDNDFLQRDYPKDIQWDFGIDVLKGLGYDFQYGRQDLSTHPFSIGFAPQDVRVTTRIDPNDFSNMLWSCIHEAGHALYEQGLPVESYGLPAGNSVSLGIHESQSRLWENHVGRSLAFWKHWLPKLKACFPDQLQDVSLDEFYLATNRLRPNLIRTEADELHYHLHVIIRYELEKEIFERRLKISELRDNWNDRYKQYLGVEVPDDAHGILQDVHWSHGSFGYFPTYSLGSFYAAQFYRAASNEINGLEDAIGEGDCSPLLDWLRKNIHDHGRLRDPEDLCEDVTGEPLNVKYFLEYARVKFGAIYPNY